MKQFIHGAFGKIHVLDLEKTLSHLNEALKAVYQYAFEGQTFLFVGTKASASKIIRQMGDDLHVSVVDEKWPPGLFTNFDTIKKQILMLKSIQEQEKGGDLKKYTKKEALVIIKRKQKLIAQFGGFQNMLELPDVIFIVDTAKEHLALSEARALGIKVVAIVDTNGNPDGVDHIIPANDDSVKGLTYIMALVQQAYADGRAAGNGRIPERKEKQAIIMAERPGRRKPGAPKDMKKGGGGGGGRGRRPEQSGAPQASAPTPESAPAAPQVEAPAVVTEA